MTRASLNPFTPAGRMRRSHYVIAIITINAISLMLRRVMPSGDAVLMTLVGTLVLWPSYCIMSKRLHDAGRGGSLALTATTLAIAGSLTASMTTARDVDAMAIVTTMIGLTLAALGIAIAVMRPAPGPNSHGPDPRRSTSPVATDDAQ